MANKTNFQSILNTADVVCCKRPNKSPSWIEEEEKTLIFSVRLFIATVLGYEVCISVITEGRDYDIGTLLWVESYR